MIKRLVRKWREMRTDYQSLVEVSISRDRLLYNFHAFRELAPACQVAPVLKSNAYGHGLAQVAEIIDAARPPFIIIDSYYEAVILRNEKIRSPLLVMGYTSDENIYKNELREVSFALISLDQVASVAEHLGRPIRFHLKVDTGMSRHGVRIDELDIAISNLKRNSNIVLEGVFTHLSDSDNEDPSHTRRQIEVWNKVAGLFKREFQPQEFPALRYFHAAATSGAFFHKEIEGNMIRLGLGLYGNLITATQHSKLRLLSPLEMKSVLSAVKTIKKGDAVGYNNTFIAQHDMRIAAIPAGYFEGIDRRLSNCGFVKVAGVFCPILGRVSMNITIIDVSSVPHAKRGDKAILISSEQKDKNSVMAISEQCKTVPWEILIHISPFLRRKVV